MLSSLAHLQKRPVVCIPLRGVRVSNRRREYNLAYELERKQFKEEVSRIRVEHKKAYWELQTQVEL